MPEELDWAFGIVISGKGDGAKLATLDGESGLFPWSEAEAACLCYLD
jgi:hypothetical protein